MSMCKAGWALACVLVFAGATSPRGETPGLGQPITEADITAWNIDVLPDGTANNIIDGVIRARYRHGFDRQVLMEPGEIAESRIDLTSTSAVFGVAA